MGFLVLLFTLTHVPQVQRFIGRQVADALSEQLGTEVSVGRVDLGFLNRIIVDDVVVLDQQQQDMLKASRLSAKIDILPLLNGRVSISSAQLFGAHFKLYRDSIGAPTNFQFLLDSLASRDTTKHTPLDLRINSLIVRHTNIQYDQKDQPFTPDQLNPKHLNFSDVNANIILKTLTDDSLNLNVKRLSFQEQSGLQVNRLTMHIEASHKQATVSNFMIQLPKSTLSLGDLTARYQVDDGRLVPGTLNYQGRIEESDITLSDLSWLYHDISSVTNKLIVNSSFSGTDNSIDIHHLTAHSADNAINIDLSGFLHHWESAPAWQLQLDQLQLTSNSIAFTADKLKNKVNLPEMVNRLGDINITGYAEGEGHSVDAQAQLHTGAGQLDVTINMDEQRTFCGHAQSSGIQFGHLLDDQHFGEMAMDLDFSGQLHSGTSPTVNATGSVTRFFYNGYEFQNIDIDASYSPDNIGGTVSIDDTNVRLTAEGTVGRTGAAPHVQLNIHVDELRPDLLNLTQQWKGAVFCGDLTADFNAANINNAQGTLDLDNFRFESSDTQYSLNHLHVVSGYDDDQKHYVKMNSDFGELLLRGTFDYATLPQSIANIVSNHLPTLPGLPAVRKTNNDFAFQLQLDNTELLNILFDVPFATRQPLLLGGFVNDSQQTISIMGNCPAFTYDGNEYSDAALHADTKADTLYCTASVTRNNENGNSLLLNVRTKAADNQLSASINWDNHAEQRMSGVLNTNCRFFLSPDGRQTSAISVLPSQLVIRNSDWQVEPAEIIYSKDNITVNNLAVKHGQQHVIVNGRASKNPQDSLSVDIVDVDVEYILDIVNFHSVDFSGMASGRAYASSLFDRPKAEAHLKVNDFLFEHGRMGVLDVSAIWNDENKIIELDGITNDGPASMTFIGGYIDPSRPGYIDLDIKAIGTHIDFAHSFTSSFADRVEGQAQGAVRLYGPLNNVNLTGRIVVDGEINVRQLNTTYTMRADTVDFIPDNILFSNCSLYDRDGHVALLNGALHHQHLTRMTFDLDVEADNLLAYDFHDFGTDTFYGTVYGTGKVSIQGRPGRVTFDIDVTPEANTVFVYNVSSPDAITNQEFITWESTRYEIRNTRYENTSADVSSLQGNLEPRTSNLAPRTTDIFLNFIIRCTPDATMRLLMDAKTNDYITLNGDGTIRATYYNKGGLQMFGTYVVDRGTYNITIQELIKKNFTFQNGGTITFGGNPFDAQLNLQALHTVNGVSLSDLNVGNSFSSNTIRVNCLMNISGVANSPQVDFDLAMPTVSADEQQMIRSLINGQQGMNQQVLYLLGIGRFYPQTDNNATAESPTQQSQTSLAMYSLLSGTISSQINSLLKTVINNNNWNFGANITTGDEGWNNAEYGGIISGRLLNNRLLLNGQFGYRDRTTSSTPSFIGDFDVQYLLTPTGSIAIKMYNQTNDRYFTRSSLNTQGLGFIFKKDFNTFSDLFRRHRTIPRDTTETYSNVKPIESDNKE